MIKPSSPLLLIICLIVGFTPKSYCQPDSCAPNFRQIYNFNIGDVFQRVEESWVSAGGTGLSVVITSKYEIVEKDIIGDSLIYKIEGIKFQDYNCDEPLACLDQNPKSSIINDQLIFVDSANHFLNHCAGDYVSGFLSSADANIDNANEYYCELFIDTIEGKVQKKLGGLQPIYHMEDDSLVAQLEIGFNEQFEPGLGSKKRTYSFFEVSSSSYLQGYIKNGDTTGVITPDNELTSIQECNEQRLSITIYPNPSTGLFYLKSDEFSIDGASCEVYDAVGNLVHISEIQGSIIDLSGLPKGIYIMRFIGKSGIYDSVKKLVH